MTDTTTTSEASETSTAPTTASPGLSSRIRTTLASAQDRIGQVARARAPWAVRMDELPKLRAQLQTSLEAAYGSAKLRLRDGVELPSRQELSSLAQRLLRFGRAGQGESALDTEPNATDQVDVDGASADVSSGDQS